MIRVEGLRKRYEAVEALFGVSFEVRRGEIFGLVGPDGAGKTTTLRILAGVLSATSGSFSLGDGETVRIGYMPQRFSLYEDCTVWENLRLVGALYGASGAEISTRGEQNLALTGLLPFRDRFAGRLSGGMKQKLALAAALTHDPDVLILDEPGTGVDPVSRREFWRILYALNREGKTMLVSTPYMDEAQLCTHVGFMHQGRIIARGTPKELCASYPYQVMRLSAAGRHRWRDILADCPIADMNAFGEAMHLAAANPGEVRAAVAEALQAAGIGKYILDEVEPTLEDVFVHLAAEA